MPWEDDPRLEFLRRAPAYVKSNFSSLPSDCSELQELLKTAKPEWHSTERKAVFAKLSHIRVRDVSSFIMAIKLEGGDSLNSRLRSAGLKGFTAETLGAFKEAVEGVINHWYQSEVLVNRSSTDLSWNSSKERGLRSLVTSGSDRPIWDSPAPAGWWQVVAHPCAWSYAQPDIDSAKVAVHVTGKVLAMTRSRIDIRTRMIWLKLRDERAETDQWLNLDASFVAVATADGNNRYGVILEEVATNECSPSLEHREAHALQVRAFRRAEKKLISKKVADSSYAGSLLHHVRACYDTTSSVGSVTCLNARPDLLPSALLPPALSRSMDTLLTDGYLIIDECLTPEQTEAFVEEVARMDGGDQHEMADDYQFTAGQRDDRVLWVDHLAIAKHWPAISRSVALLKAIAHALNPAASERHAVCASAKDGRHGAELVPPATDKAVLTVPAKAMLSTYPGEGAKYIPHTDNHQTSDGSRANPREFTAILYANAPDWDRQRDGGCLRIYLQSQGLEECPKAREDNTCVVEPFGGRLVIFASDLWHEVRPAWRKRRALTLWIFRPTADCRK